MQVSFKWLAELVDLPKETTPQQIADKLTAAGLEVEAIVDLGASLKGVVVARVLSCEAHPGADKLKVCKIDGGPSTPDGAVDVVCGAANVVAGALVCFATPGTVLPGDKVISVAAVRGVTSHGMLCSASELGLEAASDGLLLLQDDNGSSTLGAPCSAAIGRDDVVFTISVTPNRPDALSHLGVARELAAAFRTRLKVQAPTCAERGGPIDALATVSIEDVDGCPRYTCRVIEDVVVGPSPRHVQARLAAVGLRSINNIVDVTNLVMMERGIPLHAFDFDKIGKQGTRAAIVVRNARAGEPLVTLDGKERALVEGDVVIGDTVSAGHPHPVGEGRAIALAGVMGGRDTEVTSTTTRILLESAYFSAARVRRTARRLDLHSEASHRFERGADPNGCLQSLDRAAALISDLSAFAAREGSGREPKGRVARGVIDTYPKKIAPVVVTLRPKKAAQLLGVPLKLVDEASASKLLLSLGLEVEGREADAIRFRVPTFRPDLTREVDLIEELLRLLGMDQIPATLPARSGESESVLFDARRHRALSTGRRALAACGYDEAINLAFAAPADVAAFGPVNLAGDDVIRVKNPLGEERSLMRRSLLPGLVQNVALNHRRGVVDVRLYEAGTVFLGKNPEGAVPRHTVAGMPAGGDAFAIERPRLAGVATGTRAPGSFDHKAESLDFFDVKGHLEELLGTLGTSVSKVTPLDPTPVFLHPRAAASLSVITDRGEEVCGFVGELHPDLTSKYELKSRAVVFDLDTDVLARAARWVITARALPRFPAVRRDFALVVDEALPAAALHDGFARNDAVKGLLESVEIFDVYQGKGVPPGKKSVAVGVTLRADDRTLTDVDVQRLQDALVAGVKSLGAEVRAG
ncbi:MAG: phenylalanine--tRNA ligase subunit beta [Deltaproteobacteria bacterium]|nr:phenylalanine--tRNA ligase subunit beta [Deltaproteobacteria bacterium]